jgi:hypothetical protein
MKWVNDKFWFLGLIQLVFFLYENTLLWELDVFSSSVVSEMNDTDMEF